MGAASGEVSIVDMAAAMWAAGAGLSVDAGKVALIR
jgi:hypothetical protein